MLTSTAPPEGDARFERLKAEFRGLGNRGSAVRSRLRQASSLDYWRSLQPNLPLLDGRRVDWNPPEIVSHESTVAALESYRSRGFLSLNNVLSRVQAERMRECIETLRQNNWPAVFGFVYDAFWAIGRSEPLSSILGEIVGGRYCLLPRIWAHYVRPTIGSSGWHPHTDGEAGSPQTISVWIPLSEATVGNGCMHVVKKDVDTEELASHYSAAKSFTSNQVNEMLRNVRALPASPGQVLCWDERTIHWGGSFDAGSEPRVSLALEFRSAFCPSPTSECAPFDPFMPPPTFGERLDAIGRAILLYRRFESFDDTFGPVSELVAFALSGFAANMKRRSVQGGSALSV